MRSWYHPAFVVGLLAAGLGSAEAQDANKPNIVVIMGDDIGWSNIGVYNQGIMSGRTPNLDQLAAEGMRFTDYYAEASCTAGRANFITGELPIRTGMTTVGQAGSPIGIPAEAITIATALKAQGYATGQFGKNHLGDLNEFLPTVHGFDEFFGYLYHLDAMEDPCAPQLSAEPARPGRAAQHGPQLGHRHRRSDRAAALGQDRQAADRGRRPALSRADEDGRRRDPRRRAQVHRRRQERRQAVLPLAQPDPHARRHPSLGQVRGHAHGRERLEQAGSRHGPARRHRRLGHGAI